MARFLLRLLLAYALEQRFGGVHKGVIGLYRTDTGYRVTLETEYKKLGHGGGWIDLMLSKKGIENAKEVTP